MGFLEDLKNGDIKTIIIVIFGFLFFNLYWRISSVQFARSTRQSQCQYKNNKESMADVSPIDIKEAVRQVYLADVQAIRNLSEVANKLQKEGLTIAGDLTVSGKIKAGAEISNNSYSLSGLNTSIGSVNKTLNDTITNINKNFKSIGDKITGIEKELAKKYDKSGGQISGSVDITGYLTGTNFTMNTGGSNKIQTLGNTGQFLGNGSVYFGSGACHGDTSRFGGCPG